MSNTSLVPLTTRRLLLRPLALDDSPAIQQLFPHWNIVRFLNAFVPWPYPEDGALSFLRDIALPAIVEGRAWFWSIRLKTAPEQLIGVISLMEGEEDNRGFWLATEWQGRGLMMEACEVVTDYWFEVLGKPVLRVPKAIANEASRKISQRDGMRVVWTGERDFVSGTQPAELWEITAEEWRNRAGKEVC